MATVNAMTYIGKHHSLEVIDTTGFDVLTPETVFVKQEASVVFPDGVRVPFANPNYLEYRNSPSGRKALDESGLNHKLIEAILLIWGDTPVLPDIE